MNAPVYVAVKILRSDNPEWPEPIIVEDSLVSFDTIPSSYEVIKDADDFCRSVRINGGDEPSYHIGTLDGEMRRNSRGMLLLWIPSIGHMTARESLDLARSRKSQRIWLAYRIQSHPSPPSPPPPAPPAGPTRQVGFDWN